MAMAEAQASTDSDRRAQVYRALAHRNRLIGALRWGLPAIGVLVLAGLVVQIVIANIANSFSIDNVRIARDKLIVDAPAYAGIMGNGTKYEIVAEAASTPLGGSDKIDLELAKVDLLRTDGYLITATAKSAQFSLSQQIVDVKGEMIVIDDDGMRAQLLNSTIDWTKQTLVAKDNVHVVFKDGTMLTGSALVFDADAQTWDFKFVKLTASFDEEAN